MVLREWRYYQGKDGSVRQVLHIPVPPETDFWYAKSGERLSKSKIVECTLEEFNTWAQYEVTPDWRRVY